MQKSVMAIALKDWYTLETCRENIISAANLRGVEEVCWRDSRRALRSARSPKGDRLSLYPTYCEPKDE
jgi:hypothetical protein